MIAGGRILFAAAVAAAALCTIDVQAQTYPSQDIHFVVGFPPGSGADIVTRFIGDKLQAKAKRTVVVENKVGAAGNLAVETVARAKPDGYTILLGTGSATAASMHLYKNPPVDVTRALRIAATLSKQAFMIAVDAKSPYKTLPELTEAMKKKGEAANYGVAAMSGIITGELYKSLTGVKAIEVRFRTGADSLPELFSGKLDYVSIDPQLGLAQQAQGKIRILGHSAGARFKSLPDMPTMAEGGVTGMDMIGWWALHVPAGTPDAVVKQINGWVQEILAEKDVQDFFAKTGGDVFSSSVDAGQDLFLKEEKQWAEYVRIAKIEKQ